MAAPKQMMKAEVKRREDMALEDVAATARYHAGRLPTTSKWHASLAGLAKRLEPAPAGEEESED